jgi:hypothetical protein
MYREPSQYHTGPSGPPIKYGQAITCALVTPRGKWAEVRPRGFLEEIIGWNRDLHSNPSWFFRVQIFIPPSSHPQMENLMYDLWSGPWKTRTTILAFYPTKRFCVKSMGIWEGVFMDSLKFHLGLPCPTLLRPEGDPPLKWPYDH